MLPMLTKSIVMEKLLSLVVGLAVAIVDVDVLAVDGDSLGWLSFFVVVDDDEAPGLASC